jgi:hypothetical protein
MLKRVVVKGSATKIYNCFLPNPSVNCYLYSIRGELVQQQSGQHTTWHKKIISYEGDAELYLLSFPSIVYNDGDSMEDGTYKQIII